jgi:lipopolysaccharide transport system ATP-binding protein
VPDPVITVERLGKKYRLGQIGGGMPGAGLLRRWRGRRPGRPAAPDDWIWALDDVSFEVERGQIVGIIGRNGAGKSTLLKILSRITEPTSGRAVLRGRVGSLLEVGTGFHPELTGRENIYLNGAILGMKKREIARRFDEIVAFSEVERFMDTPVKRYSSGMYVRLAFAVAAHLEPEILLVDEVLAVGDVAFQKKCLGKMGDVAKEGRTVLFVSHNMAAVESLCGTAHLLDQGRLAFSGPALEVAARYLAAAMAPPDFALPEVSEREGDGRVRFTDVVIRDADGQPVKTVCSGQDILVSLGYSAADNQPVRNASVMIAVHSLLGQFLFMCGNEMSGSHFDLLRPTGRVNCRIPRLPLSPGDYGLDLHFAVNGIMADWVKKKIQFTVTGADFFGSGRLPPASHGGLLVDHRWSIEGGAGQ